RIRALRRHREHRRSHVRRLPRERRHRPRARPGRPGRRTPPHAAAARAVGRAWRGGPLLRRAGAVARLRRRFHRPHPALRPLHRRRSARAPSAGHPRIPQEHPMSKKRIAVIPGDGIGKEVMPEGVRVVDAAARKFGIDLQFDHFDFSSWEYCEKHGKYMPDDWKEQVGGHDAIFFGAVGWPEKIADQPSLWQSLLLFRREFDQYVNLRPARLMPGIIAPVVRKDGSRREPGEIDMYIVRENTEGEYSAVGGRMYPGTEREIVMQETIMSRHGVDRVLKFAFELAQSRPKKHLTSATKSNGIAITMPYWDERVAEMARKYPGIKTDKFHIDILTAHFVQRPD